MKRITYLGPHAEVNVESIGVVKRGDSCLVKDEVAGRLLESGYSWTATDGAAHEYPKEEPIVSDANTAKEE